MTAFSFTPWASQIEDLSRLISTPNTPLFSDPGAGKTPVAAMYSRYAHDHLGYKVVWTMPKSLLKKNLLDIEQFGGFEKGEVVIVRGTPERRLALMKSPRAKVFLMTGTGYSNEWRLLLNAQPTCRVSIHDEFHLYYSSHGSKRTQEWYQACEYMFSVIPMTGSILKGRLSSAYPVFHAKFPLFYGDYQSFMSHHAIYDLQGRIEGWKNHDRLNVLLKQIGIRRSFAEVHGKENKVIQVHTVPLQGKHAELHAKWRAMGVLEREEDFLKSEGNGGLQVMRERQLLAHPESMGVGFTETTEKDEELEVYIEEALYTGERLVIFSTFVPEQERIYKMIQKMGAKVALINGNVSGTKREQIDEDFKANKIQFVVASPQTAGVGFNWHFLHTVIFVTAEYQDDSFVQAYRRGIRGKRETPLRIIVMVYQGTIEQKILTIVDRKSRDANLVDETKEELTLSHRKTRIKTKADQYEPKPHNVGDKFDMSNF